MAQKTEKVRPASEPAPHESRCGLVEDLAREIYVRTITSARATSRTAASLASEAFEQAEAFHVAAGLRRAGGAQQNTGV